MTTCFVEERKMGTKEMEKQMGGCMAGFLHLFDRHQILAGKRLPAAKRLALAGDSSSSSAVSGGSPPAIPVAKGSPLASEERKDVVLESPLQLQSPSPSLSKTSSSASPLPLPLPVFEDGWRSTWKLNEAPRLSLDSRVGGKGGIASASGRSMEERRGPSVVARLMGLDALPDSGPESFKKAELRRSASESRVSRDLLQYRFLLDSGGWPQPQPPAIPEKRKDERALKHKCEPLHQRKSFFDSQDVFPDPIKRAGSLLGEFEKRLKNRGIAEQAKDLETLKQILEALQLKGLLHSKRSSTQFERRNFVLDRQFEEAPIVVIKPARSPRNQMVRRGYHSPPPLSSPSKCSSQFRRTEAISPRARQLQPKNLSSGRGRMPGNETQVRSPRRMSTNVESSRKLRTGDELRSPSSPKKTGSPRNRRRVERISSMDEESSSLSEVEAERQRSRMGDYREGRNLLERCDKLLHSIAEMTANDQPSPVSVLDSSFYKDEGSPPPISMKKCLDFKDQLTEVEDGQWSPAISPIRSKSEEEADDEDFVYVSEIFRALRPREGKSHKEIFAYLERKFYTKASSFSDTAALDRSLLFDTVEEILERTQIVNSWKAFAGQVRPPVLRQVWAEVHRLREEIPTQDICKVVCAVLGKDMAPAADGWSGDRSEELSEAVLDIERLIFKDLVAETIRDLAAAGPKRTPTVAPRRKLVF